MSCQRFDAESKSLDEYSMNDVLIRGDPNFQKTHPMTAGHFVNDSTQVDFLLNIGF